MTKHLVLTGGAGFIGSHTVEHVLKNTDWRITVIDRLTYAGNLNRLTDIDIWEKERGRVKFVYHDFRSELDPHMVEPADYFIHMGAESHVDRSLYDPALFAQSNVLGTINMMQLSSKLGAEKFIQVSTDEVYGAMYDGRAHKEGEPHRPSNPYAASKAAAEDFVYAFWKSYNMPVVISNTMNNFGERQDIEKFIPRTIRSILQGEPVVVHVRKDQSGATVDVSSRCWLHARNHADALLFLLKNGIPGERYNVVGKLRDVRQIAEFIAHTIGKPINIREEDFHSFRRGHDMHYGLDGSRLAAMGWVPPVPFELSLAETVRWSVQNPRWLQL